MFLTDAFLKIHGKFIMPLLTCFGRKILRLAPPACGKWLLQKNKGNAPMQGFSQEERLPTTRQSFKMHEGASFGLEPKKATSLQDFASAKITYFNGTMAITLQEVLKRTLRYSNGV